ncbi:hypothetical protein CMI47_20485 [Candidatus Pacearchaeota archaeon]|nr:hypothetical protein [Candidatus Pacearchaeota archaeon]|tara:strand:- start:555 stop:1061 length:507 start_codon:yes stop_codon:yes gene_type:complete
MPSFSVPNGIWTFIKGCFGLALVLLLFSGGLSLWKFAERALPGLKKINQKIVVTTCNESIHDVDDQPIRCSPGAEVVFVPGADVVVCACNDRKITNIPPKRGFFERTFTRLHRWWNGPDKPEPTPPAAAKKVEPPKVEPPKAEAPPPPPAPPKAQKLGVLAWLKGFYG